MKVGSIVRMIRPGDNYSQYLDHYGIVISLYSNEDEKEFIIVRVFCTDIEHISHREVGCYRYRFREVL